MDRISRRRDVQVNLGGVAAVVAVARADDQRDQVAGLHDQIVDGGDRCLLAVAEGAGREPSAQPPAAQLDRPGHAVAAAAMRVGDNGRDPHPAGDRAPPADGHRPARRGMHHDAVRLDQARDIHGPVRRIGDHVGRVAVAPGLDELVAPCVRRLLSEVAIDPHRRLAREPEVIEPRGQGVRRDVVRFGQRGDLRAIAALRRLGRGGEVLGGRPDDFATTGDQVSGQAADVAEQERRPARPLQPGSSPDDRIPLMPVAGIAGRQVEHDLIPRQGLRERLPQGERIGQRRDGGLPGAVEGVGDAVEPPQGALPLPDRAGQRREVARRGGFPPRADVAERAGGARLSGLGGRACRVLSEHRGEARAGGSVLGEHPTDRLRRLAPVEDLPEGPEVLRASGHDRRLDGPRRPVRSADPPPSGAARSSRPGRLPAAACPPCRRTGHRAGGCRRRAHRSSRGGWRRARTGIRRGAARRGRRPPWRRRGTCPAGRAT